MAGFAFESGKSNLPRTGSVSLESRGHKRFCSLAAFSTLLTVVLDALQLRAMFVWLRPNPDNRMISRYLVINGDLLCNAFTLQSAWIHYKGNRYHLTGISVSDDRNCGIHQNGFVVLRFRNTGSESPGILKIIIATITFRRYFYAKKELQRWKS